MILVLLGTQNNDFSRLLREIDRQINKGNIKDNVLVQAGFTKYESENMQIFDMKSIGEIDRLIDSADLIITHGGAGTIINSIKKGKKVIAVARLKEYFEHVNNHQKEIINRFNRDGYIIGINDAEKLEDALIKVANFNSIPYIENSTKIIEIIEKFIDES
ncbi:hypothetical protein D3C87_1475740 [compost metagenome]